MIQMKKISIIIPTYKPQAYIWECLDSISRQKAVDFSFETIIILNGPLEPYHSQLETYILSHPKLNAILYYNKERGVSAARNVGIAISSGEYITFVDDDDFISESYLHGMLEQAAPDCIVMAHPIAFNSITKQVLPYRITKEYERTVKRGSIPALSVRCIYSGVWMKLFPRNIIEWCVFDTTLTNSEDSLFVFEISRKFKMIRCAPPNAIYYRRVRKNSAINISTKRKVKNAMVMILKYTRVYTNAPSDYNFFFYITRILGTIKGVIVKNNY